MTFDVELCEAVVARDQVSGAVVNVSLRHTRKRSHHAEPPMVGIIADARCEDAGVPSRLMDRALATQRHALRVVATRFALMSVLWVTWQLQSLGTAASLLARVGAVKWLDGRLPVRQTGRDFAELHYVVVDAATCAAVVFDDHVALDDGVPRARTLAGRACTTTLECVAFFRAHRAPMKEFFFCS